MRLKDKYPHLVGLIGAAAKAMREGPTDADLLKMADRIEATAHSPSQPTYFATDHAKDPNWTTIWFVTPDAGKVDKYPASRRHDLKIHRQRIAKKCKVRDGMGLAGSRRVVVDYRGHRCIYEMSGQRPVFIMRNTLSKPEEPTKIVQDGMRLAAVWHVHPERRPKPPSLMDIVNRADTHVRMAEIKAMMTERNSILDDLVMRTGLPADMVRPAEHADWHRTYRGVPESKTYHADTTYAGRWLVQPGDTLTSIARRHYGDGLLWTLIYGANKGVIGKDPGRIVPGQELTLPAYWKAKPAPSVDELTFEQAALRHVKTSVLGAMPAPDSVVITPEVSSVLGYRTMSEYLAIWAAMVDAVRWKK